MMFVGIYAQTTTVTYTAKSKIDRFEEIQYFVGATAVQSHEFVKEGDATVGNGTVVYEGTVTEFANNCLQWQSDLISIVVPDGVKKLGYQSFYACQNMTDISLPATLTEIGEEAFYGMTSLADVWCDAEASDVTWNGSDNSGMFMPEKATQFHVGNAAAWLEKFPEANVTFVDLIDTAIQQVGRQTTLSGHAVYDLQGRMIVQPDSQLPKGIYIQNGKKYMVK